MSVSPAMNFLKPPPEPETPTGTRTLGAVFWNSSAIASLIGNTVLEPSMRTVPVSAAALPPPALSEPPLLASCEQAPSNTSNNRAVNAGTRRAWGLFGIIGSAPAFIGQLLKVLKEKTAWVGLERVDSRLPHPLGRALSTPFVKSR